MPEKIVAIACTGDPLLDMVLEQCQSIQLAGPPLETVDDLPGAAAKLLFVSPATGNLPKAGTHAATYSICCLVQGEAPSPPGIPVLAGDPITPAAVDAWVERTLHPTVSQATQNRPTAGWSIPFPAKSPVPAPPPVRKAAPAEQRPMSPKGVSILQQRVVALWGGKPGAGRSTLALGLSELLSRHHNIRVCTVDLNPYNSSLSSLLGREQEVSSWFHFSQMISDRKDHLGEALHWVRPNWAVVSGPAGRPEWVEQLTGDWIEWLVGRLRSQFDYIILDPEVRPGTISQTALRLSQIVLLTVSPDYADLVDTRRQLQMAIADHLTDLSRCHLVLSRWLETDAMPGEMASQFIGLPISARIPTSPEAAIAAAARGEPITRVENSAARPVVQAMEQALQLIAEALAPTVRSGGWRGLFTKR